MQLKRQWPELLMLLLAVVGLILSVLLRSALFSYLTIALAGFVAGRVYYLKKFREPILPFVLIIAGFLAGYLIGSLWVSRVAVLVVFLLVLLLSYQLHLRGILKVQRSERFVK